MIYVCDRCGATESRPAVPEGDEWTCSRCSRHAAWEYPEDKSGAAREHAAQIAGRGNVPRIFRDAHGGRSA